MPLRRNNTFAQCKSKRAQGIPVARERFVDTLHIAHHRAGDIDRSRSESHCQTVVATRVEYRESSHRMAAGAVGPTESIMGVLVAVNMALKGTASSHRGAVRRLKSRAKLSRVKTVGNQTGVTELYSLAILKAPVAIQ